MYLRTPKRYQRGYKRSVIRWRSCLLYILIIPLLFVLIGIYENADRWIPQINQTVGDIVDNMGDRIEQVNAPPPTATPDPSNDLQRADGAWRRGSMQEAVNIYEGIVDATPNNLTVHYRYTLGLIMDGRFEEAAKAAENAITANPFSADAWAIKAMAHNRLDNTGEAISSALHALELASPQKVEENPQLAMSRARAQAFLAEAYLNDGQGDRAFTLVNQALETDPDSFEAYQVRGRVNWEYNFDLDSALEDLREAYTIAPNMVYVGIWLARLEQGYLQNSETALDIYQSLAEQNPGNAQVLFALGEHYFRVDGNYTEARSYFSRCVEADPQSAPCYYMLGRSQMQQDEALNAQESFARAIELDPNGGDGYYYWWLAETHSLGLGQCPQALTYLRQGYPIAQEAGITDLIDAFETRFAECGSPVTTVTEEAEVTPEANTENSA